MAARQRQARSRQAAVAAATTAAAVATASANPVKDLATLLAPLSLTEFFARIFEKQHALVPWSSKPPALASTWQPLFTWDTLLDLVEREELFCGRDMNFCRYRDGLRISLNPGHDHEEHDAHGACQHDHEPIRVSRSLLESLVHQQQATVQFFQPQRFLPALQQLVLALEEEFGCLVGINAYLTPPGAQGLAPHHDDIEAFVWQMEGRKQWHLYPPLQVLASTYSPDLPREKIGEAMASPCLAPGDVLYFPRGTIHEAQSTGDGLSTHLTLSTYQNWSWGHLLASTLPTILEGLPIGWLKICGQLHGTAQSEVILAHMREVLQSDAFWDQARRHLLPTVDQFALDFVTSRMPPPQETSTPPLAAASHPHAKKAKRAASQRRTRDFVATTHVQFLHRSHVRLVAAGAALRLDGPEVTSDLGASISQSTDMESGGMILYYGTLGNPVNHMMGAAPEDTSDSDEDEGEDGMHLQGVALAGGSLSPALRPLLGMKSQMGPSTAK